MSVDIRVPALGESVFEVTVSRWLKKEGDSVAAGEDIVELETDKANSSLPSEQAGILERILHKEGETVAVNEVLATIAETDGTSAGAANNGGEDHAGKATAPAAAASPANGGQGDQENGRRKPATPVAERIAAEKGLDLAQIHGSGARGKVLKEDVAGSRSPAPAADPTPPRPAPALAAGGEGANPTPVLATSGSAVNPTPTLPAGGEGARRVSTPAPPVRPLAASVGAESAATAREERVVMSKRRQIIARNLKEAQSTAAMLTTLNEVDMSAIMELRKRRKDSFKERFGVGLGFMSFFTKAAVGALKAFPLLNAEIQGTEIVIKRHYDIGIAVGAQEGLVVPVVRDADTKTFAAIEREIADLAARARDNRLSVSELMGGTFTITNGGIFGSLMSTPILNYPQVGILGMHKIAERPVVVEGQVIVRPMMYVALSYDHRIVDGSEAVRFLVRLKELVEDPETLLLEG